MATALWLAALGASPDAAEAQTVRDRLRVVDSTTVQVLEMRDGSRLVGRVIDIGDSTVVFRSSGNDLALRIADIAELEERPADAVRNGKLWFRHPHQTTLVLGPTGRTLERGQGFFTLHELFFAALQYGVTNHVTLGAGATLLPGVSLDEQIIYFLPKIAVARTPLVNLAVGAVIVRAGDIFDISNEGAATFGVLYGAGTFGGPDANLTTGLGFGFVGDRISSQPLVQVGGQLRVSPGVALITENWMIGRQGDDAYVLSWSGLRFLHRKATFDAAVAFAPEEGGWLPWVGVTLGF
ncbi:MAG TPA: hypothetical protein VK922_06385 [Gemmatimonadaceae bacterium]|nr:hypothetical protein [Gemmatimonadaceae bacterium]